MVMQTAHFDLRSARINEGHSVRSLASDIGIAYNTLLRLERGGAVHPATAKKVADHFGIRVTDLMPSECDTPKEAA